MTQVSTGLALPVWLAAMAFSAGAIADTYYDHATVLSATPVTRTVYENVAEEVCRTHRVPQSTSTADKGSSGQGGSLADIIRQELASAAPLTPRECRIESVRKPRTETVAYRVRYRYGNATYTRTMEKKPGERIRVRVELALN